PLIPSNPSTTHQMTTTISQKDGMNILPSRSAESLLHNIALKNAVSLLQQSQRNFLTSSLDFADQALAYRDFTNLLQDIGNLLAISPNPAASYALVQVRHLLVLS